MDRPDIKIADINDIATKAGNRLMELRGNVTSTTKPDGSAVSKADLEANQIVLSGLAKVTPDIPVISEEADKADNLIALASDLRWVTDPLDGTDTYLAGYDGFGVHIALVEKGIPILGVVYLPAIDGIGHLYYTGDDGHAYKKEGNNPAVQVRVPTEVDSTRLLRASVHFKQELRPDSIAGDFYDAVAGVGGARVCIAAEGKAEIAWMVRQEHEWAYSHWDVAAADAFMRAAGGIFVDFETGEDMSYNNENFAVKSGVAGNKDVLNKLFKFNPQ